MGLEAGLFNEVSRLACSSNHKRYSPTGPETATLRPSGRRKKKKEMPEPESLNPITLNPKP